VADGTRARKTARTKPCAEVAGRSLTWRTWRLCGEFLRLSDGRVDAEIYVLADAITGSHRASAPSAVAFRSCAVLALIVLVLNEMVLVLVLDGVSSSTSTSTAGAEYEYEKPGKTSIETPKHANSATSKPWRTVHEHEKQPEQNHALKWPVAL
jgi:hypothetical protein